MWRRRHCPRCGKDFTTQEKPVFNVAFTIQNPKTGHNEPFYQGKLIASIARSFAHDEAYGAINALPLSESVIAHLLQETEPLDTRDVSTITHMILQRFDPTAAAQYALVHNIPARTTRRRKGL